MARYLVTGAAGFIGAATAQALLDEGHTVVGLDNLDDAYDGQLKQWRLDRLRPARTFGFVQGDLCDAEVMETLFEGVPFDGVLHLAARAGVRRSVQAPHLYVDSNVTGTLTLLESCQRHDIRKLVVASSSSLYGEGNPLPYTEDQPTDRLLSPYAASKKAMEGLCYAYHHLYGLDVSVLRYFTVYGPAARPDMSIFRFVQWISEGRPLRLYGDGEQLRDFTYISDIVRGTLGALKPLGYEIINLGGDQPHSMNELIHLIERFTGKRATIERHPPHSADVASTWANITKAKALLAWEPRVALEEGIAETVAWYEREQAWARQVAT